MRHYLAIGECRQEEVFVEDAKIILVKYRAYERCECERGQKGFKELLTRVLNAMIKDNVIQFKELLKEIQNSDKDNFEIGKRMLDEERKRYTLD